jgi:uracil phosphoribosyltransferase
MLTIVDHPCLKAELTRLRDKATPPSAFHEASRRAATYLLAEALRQVPVEPAPVETPLAPAQGWRLKGRVVFVPVLRAGLGMLEAARALVPEAIVGFIGLKRDEQTAVAHRYYENIPGLEPDATVFIIDPMLATGGSMADAAAHLKLKGARRLVAVSLLAAPEGVEAMTRRHPDVPVYTGALDERLTPAKYIYPGLGDAGDRLFGTL